jgi:hypothetical protein
VPRFYDYSESESFAKFHFEAQGTCQNPENTSQNPENTSQNVMKMLPDATRPINFSINFSGHAGILQ